MSMGGTMSFLESIPALDDLPQVERLPAAGAVESAAAENHDRSRGFASLRDGAGVPA